MFTSSFHHVFTPLFCFPFPCLLLSLSPFVALSCFFLFSFFLIFFSLSLILSLSLPSPWKYGYVGNAKILMFWIPDFWCFEYRKTEVLCYGYRCTLFLYTICTGIYRYTGIISRYPNMAAVYRYEPYVLSRIDIDQLSLRMPRKCYVTWNKFRENFYVFLHVTENLTIF